jgi:hypothetical protein
MFPFATVMVAFAVLLATRTKPCGMTIVLIGSVAIAALEIGPTFVHSRAHVKIAQQTELPRVHRS